MKRILSIALLLTIGLGIIGCGDEGSAPPAAPTTPAETTKPADATPGGPVDTP